MPGGELARALIDGRVVTSRSASPARRGSNPQERGSMEPKNLAARAAHWAAGRRKTAIFGWLGFVVVAVFVGNLVGHNKIQGADQFSGQSARAEQALYGHGLRPNDEHV